MDNNPVNPVWYDLLHQHPSVLQFYILSNIYAKRFASNYLTLAMVHIIDDSTNTMGM